MDGVSGVILKPISGAKQEGVEGFFKGVGKGVMGLVTRPTAGVIDFASGSFDAVKRYALPAFCVMLLHLLPLKMQYQGSEMRMLSVTLCPCVCVRVCTRMYVCISLSLHPLWDFKPHICHLVCHSR